MQTRVDEAHHALELHPETADERDALLRACLYPVPLAAEDARELPVLRLAGYHLEPAGGARGFGSLHLEFERPAGTENAPSHPDRHLRPLRVPSGDLLSQDDIEGTWRFRPEAGSAVQPFHVTIESGSVPVAGTDVLGFLKGTWAFDSNPNQRQRFTGSADGRTGVFAFQLGFLQSKIRVQGSFIARGEAIATYLAEVGGRRVRGQVEGLKG